ncbi:MAG: class I SAM-dependent methyltransferase [Rhodospirillales bacterium]|jgi:O-methyltransferase|nr:class I SAM-dependent methyltransferase [Rhodospirillales bacterium]
MSKIEKPHVGRFWFDTGHKSDLEIFDGVIHILKSMFGKYIFASDNLITITRNLGFLDDEFFLKAIENNMDEGLEYTIIWRTHIVCWVAKSCLPLPGAFVECGVYKGNTSGIITDYVLCGANKPFYLYDLFETSDTEGTGHDLPGLVEGLKEQVIEKFSAYKNTHVIAGHVPESLQDNHPDQVSFLHLDMNNGDAELSALDFFWDKMCPGGMVLFDDYGWMAYEEIKLKVDVFFSERGISVAELPTGQGLVIKR